jgi:iron complex transport system ATP-binding protein
MLSVQGLHFSYGTKRVLSGISFEVGPGRLCGLFGPNGVGKTTLFKCCLNLLRGDSGSILYGKKDSRGISVAAMSRLVSYVPQEHSPPFPFLVREIVLMGLAPHFGGVFGLKPEHKDRARAAMERVGIGDLAEEPYTRLSGGQRQLALIARALAQDTPIMMLDEPTSSLDFKNQLAVWNVLREIAAGGKTVLACAHDPNHVAWFCDEVVVISKGKVAASGPTGEVLDRGILTEIFGGLCQVQVVDGRRIVVPRDTP